MAEKTEKRGWTSESDLPPATVAFVYSCMNIISDITGTIYYTDELVHNLKHWVDTAWEPRQKTTTMSLVDLCFPGAIYELARAVQKLRSLEDRLPARYNLARDFGRIVDGCRRPDPVINTWFIPEERDIKDTLQNIKDVFEWILKIMLLLHDTVPRNCSAEMTELWQNNTKAIEDSVAHIQRFVTDTETPTGAASPAAVHSEPLKSEAHFTMLIERLREFSV